MTLAAETSACGDGMGDGALQTGGGAVLRVRHTGGSAAGEGGTAGGDAVQVVALQEMALQATVLQAQATLQAQAMLQAQATLQAQLQATKPL
jgi:hypothetical protein